MTPRIELTCLDMEDSLEENRELAERYKYTRYPVCQGSKDHLVGFVHVKDLFMMDADASMEDLPIRELYAVPESIPIAKLLQLLQRRHTKIAVVVDEHGGTAGIVTMSDIMEQIVGRVDDEYSHGLADEIVKKGDGRYLIDGSLSIDDLEDLLGFLPEEASECETAAGILLAAFDRIPEEGDTVSFTGRDAKATFTVADMDRHRVDKILVRVEQIPREDAEE